MDDGNERPKFCYHPGRLRQHGEDRYWHDDPTVTLDVKGAENVRGALTPPANGTATATKGANSQPQDLVASSFSSSTSTAVNQKFQWQAEPAANNTANPSGTPNLLYGLGTSTPSETGLKISPRA
jgi:hypothetical protein